MAEKRMFDLLKKCFARVKVDYIVEQGTKDFWTWRKWNSGIMEMWGTWTGTVAKYTSTMLPTGASYGYVKYLDLPVSFIDNKFSKCATVQVGVGITVVCSGGLNDSKSQVCVHFASNVGDTNPPVTINLQLKGLWKKYSGGGFCKDWNFKVCKVEGATLGCLQTSPMEEQ